MLATTWEGELSYSGSWCLRGISTPGNTQASPSSIVCRWSGILAAGPLAAIATLLTGCETGSSRNEWAVRRRLQWGRPPVSQLPHDLSHSSRQVIPTLTRAAPPPQLSHPG